MAGLRVDRCNTNLELKNRNYRGSVPYDTMLPTNTCTCIGIHTCTCTCIYLIIGEYCILSSY